ncbi:MAG TPA: NAD(P)-dependent oxidoreductase [Gaiellales bacterium]|jgi:uronate dehydrogenase
MLEHETWAVTGAAGAVASGLRAGIAARVGRLRLLDLRVVAPVHANEESLAVDLRDQTGMETALSGTHGLLHLGGLADEADFHDLAAVDIVGTFHALEAARRAGARRVVYASSNRGTGFYDTDTCLTPELPPRPDGLYGASKIAGEALARVYADKFGLEVACIRIGSYETAPRDVRQLSTWLSPADCLRAFLAAMTTEPLGFATFYGVSANTRRWWSLAPGRALGYEPRDDAEGYADALAAAQAGTTPGPQGGVYATPAYTLDRQRPSG